MSPPVPVADAERAVGAYLNSGFQRRLAVAAGNIEDISGLAEAGDAAAQALGKRPAFGERQAEM